MWILGVPFLKRFYSVYDVANSRVGLAQSIHTNDKPWNLRRKLEDLSANVLGEGSNDNPDYCFAFDDEGSIAIANVSQSEGESKLDCCWTANDQSQLPEHLKSIVKVHANMTMFVVYFPYFPIQKTG